MDVTVYVEKILFISILAWRSNNMQITIITDDDWS